MEVSKRPINTLFMLMSLDGKINSGDSDELDVDRDWCKIDGVKEGTNVFLIIVLIILIIVVIGYIILRLMGYKVYFNLSVIGSFFRSIGEKIKNIFDIIIYYYLIIYN